LRRYFQGFMLTALDASASAPGFGFWASTRRFSSPAWPPSWRGCPISVRSPEAFWWFWWRRTTPRTIDWLPYRSRGALHRGAAARRFCFHAADGGRSLRMHPLVTVLMILLGGAVAGIAGLLLVMPVLGVVMVAGQIIGELDHRRTDPGAAPPCAGTPPQTRAGRSLPSRDRRCAHGPPSCVNFSAWINPRSPIFSRKSPCCSS
jgi:hypothetical protein